MIEFDESIYLERERMLEEDIEGAKQELRKYEQLVRELMDPGTLTELISLEAKI